MANLEEAKERVRRWKRDPIVFVRENFKAEPDEWQKDVLKTLTDPEIKRVAMKASKGPGKTTVLAWSILWFMVCRSEKGHHPKGAVTSISRENLKDTTWTELAKWMGQSRFISEAFEWTRERVFAKEHPQTWFMSARAWAKTADPQSQANTLAGMHGRNLFFVLDESGGIPQSVMAAAEAGLATDGWQKIFQAGNPTTLDGPLYAACTSQRHLWHVITVNGDPDNPYRSKRVNIDWARQQIAAYGRENPWVLVNVFGEFPPSSLNTLLGPEEVEAAIGRGARGEAYQWAQKRLGVDVAREGDDRTVIFPRQGKVAIMPVIMRNAKGHEIAAKMALCKANWGGEAEFVDDTGGWGGATIEQMEMAGHHPIRVQFAGKADDPRFYNKRAEMWFRMAEWVKNGGCLPKMPELVRELTAPQYTFHNGKFQLEEKKQIKARLGYSPDLADALAVTFCHADQPHMGGDFAHYAGKSHKFEYEPYGEPISA